MKRLINIFLSLMLCLSLFGCNKEKETSLNISANDTYDKEETVTSITVDATNVIIKNKIVNGDITINADKEGSLALSNVSVKGKIIIDGIEPFVLNLSDVTANEIEIIASEARVVAMGTTVVNTVKTNNSIALVEQSVTKDGFNDLIVSDGQLAEITLIGIGLKSLTISNSALGVVLTDSKTLIEVLTANAPTELYGNGVVQLLSANSNVKHDESITPKEIILGANGVVNGSGNIETTITTTTKTPTTTTTKKPVVTTPKVTTTPKITTTTTTPQVTTTTTSSNNTPPVITVTDTTIIAGSSFNPLTGVTIYDKEDGNISVTQAHIKSNTVNMAKAGTYYVEYFYVDKGGLQVSKQRKVIVEADNAPVYISMDKNGEPILYWEKDSESEEYVITCESLSTYSETVSKRNSSHYIDLAKLAKGKTYTFTVKMLSESKVYKIGSTTFEYEDDIEEYRAGWTVNTPKDIFIKASPIGKNSGTYTIELTVSSNDADVSDIKLMDGVVSDLRGRCSTAYDLAKGIVLNPVFTEAGAYTIDYKIRHSKDGYVLNGSIDLTVRGDSNTSSGSSETLNIKPRIVSIDVNTWRSVFDKNGDKGTGITVEFAISKDLDLSYSTNDIVVNFEYALRSSNDPATKVSFNATKLGLSGVLLADKTYAAEFSYYTIDNVAAELIYRKLKDDEEVYDIDVEIIVRTKNDEHSVYKTRIVLKEY